MLGAGYEEEREKDREHLCFCYRACAQAYLSPVGNR